MENLSDIKINLMNIYSNLHPYYRVHLLNNKRNLPIGHIVVAK